MREVDLAANFFLACGVLLACYRFATFSYDTAFRSDCVLKLHYHCISSGNALSSSLLRLK